ncbi:MAG TPA: SDR family NAD(P)-dependent oxidoreductase [Stellaceae bacterium]|nr:SDR family NAD(P)-dependent oxidoreductase [Stellaceae bacterium]
MKLEGLAAIVTGGTGMGGATASALAAKGARVTVLGRRAAVVRRKAREIGGLGLACDVSDPERVSQVLAEAEAAHGVARILVNAAGDGRLAPLLMTDGTAFPRHVFGEVIATNLLGVIYATQAFAERLVAADPLPADEDGEDRRGIVINVSSLAGSDGPIGAAYAASKGGVNALTLSLAREFAGWGIRVMTIAPGSVDTEMLRDGLTPDAEAMIAGGYVFPRRMGRPEEFASLAVHLCENDYMNGSIVRFDGGVRRNALRPIVDPKMLAERSILK